MPSKLKASLPAKLPVPDTTGRSWPQGYLSGLPVLGGARHEFPLGLGRQPVAVGHRHDEREAGLAATRIRRRQAFLRATASCRTPRPRPR